MKRKEYEEFELLQVYYPDLYFDTFYNDCDITEPFSCPDKKD